MSEKQIKNKTVIPILKKMCEIAGHDYKAINWTNGSHRKLTWTISQQIEFADWLYAYLLKLYIKDWEKLTDDMPRLYYKNKKKCRRFAAEFVARLGFAIERNNKPTNKKE